MQEIAKVINISNDNVTVVSHIKSTCQSCQQVDNCASGQIAKAIPHKQLQLTLPSTLALEVGQNVTIELPQKSLLHSASQVYMLPLIGLIGFAGVGELLAKSWLLTNELLTISLSFLGGYLGFKLAQYLQNKLTVQAQLQPKIVE